MGDTLANDLNCLLVCFVLNFLISFTKKERSHISTLRIFVAYSFSNPSLDNLLILKMLVIKKECTVGSVHYSNDVGLFNKI